MTFMVAADPDAGRWSVDRDALEAVIFEKWPGAAAGTDSASTVRSVVWSMETDDGPGEVYLSADGTCLYMDVWEQYALWLAVAFRALVPPQVGLVFCDEGYTFDVAVPPGVTVDGLTESMEAAQ
jgi:hypothetical protein